MNIVNICKNGLQRQCLGTDIFLVASLACENWQSKYN